MTNRLADQTSPYLRQHADNPVDWWPWCDEALAHAREANRPILLSIGYAACHWCHVMAHESFEDEAVARVMNSLYVNTKGDREERPDIDKVYQLAHQALARRGGGWPLTMFLDPHDLLPFFAGTYFPPAPRHGLPAFVQVLEGVRDWFERKPDEVRAQNGALQRFLAEVDGGETHAAALGAAPIALAFERIAAHFDADAGGRRGGPKFPHASEVEFLLSYARRRTAPARPTPGAEADDGAARADAMARLTLARMAERGLRDHVGGGFFRYCVDAHWDIPHFEKMLYDNAQLLPLYAIAARRFDDDALAAAAEACAAWLLREMQADEGGFFSSLDADSDGEEGRFYVWQRDEIRALLTPQEYAFVERRFGLDRPPNFEGHAWHLRAVATLAEVAGALAIDVAAAQALWTGARATLARARSLRVRPGLDDKVLTAWNALAIGGGARAMRAQPSLHALRPSLERALDFLHAAQWQNGRLFASHARGTTQFRAYLDDHAFLLDALIAMLQLRWSRRDLDWAIALADVMLAWFADTERGGFYFTAHDGEALPQRPRPWLDESLPAGNGVAARALLALGRLVGDTRYLDAAERTLQAAWPVVSRSPEGACSLLLALEDFLAPRAHVILRVGEGEEASRWRDGVAALEESDADVFLIPAGETALPGLLDRQVHRSGGVAYLCRGVSCSPPIDTPQALVDALREAS